MTKVIKRRGTVEDYNPYKIKGTLQKATIDAGFTLDEKKISYMRFTPISQRSWKVRKKSILKLFEAVF